MMSAREWSKEDIKNLLLVNDRAVMKAIITIYNLQTDSEQNSDETYDANGVGFNGVDAPFLSSLAKQILSKGYLTPKQMTYGRKKILKYANQLLNIANV